MPKHPVRAWIAGSWFYFSEGVGASYLLASINVHASASPWSGARQPCSLDHGADGPPCCSCAQPFLYAPGRSSSTHGAIGSHWPWATYSSCRSLLPRRLGATHSREQSVACELTNTPRRRSFRFHVPRLLLSPDRSRSFRSLAALRHRADFLPCWAPHLVDGLGAFRPLDTGISKTATPLL